jgi:hypothetical protein
MNPLKNESWFTFRTLSKEEYEKEFPDEEIEQQDPTTDVDTDTDDQDDDGDEKEETTADALRDAFHRIAKGQAPEAEKTSYTSESASAVLAAAFKKAREAKESKS